MKEITEKIENNLYLEYTFRRAYKPFNSLD